MRSAGLRSGTYLGGIGTGGYELRADGTFHKSSIRNQALSAEPWLGIVRDAVLAVAINGKPFVVRLEPFGNISAVPSLVYHDRFPVAKLSFLDMSLYAYSALTPGNTNLSNTPAVMFTLHANNTAAAPVNITFMVAMGFGLRNDWDQFGARDTHVLGAPKVAAVPNATSRGGCAAACVGNAACLAWEWDHVPATDAAATDVAAQAPTRVDSRSVSGGSGGGDKSSGNSGGGVVKFTELGNADWQAGTLLRNGNTAPKLASEAACEAACRIIPLCDTGLFVNGTVRFGECWLSAALASKPLNNFCGAEPGESCAGFTRSPWPPPPRSQCRMQSSDTLASAYTQGFNRAGVDSGNPGDWSIIPSHSVVFTARTASTATPYNGLGSQGFFFPAGGVCDGCTARVSTAGSLEELLGALRSGGGLPATGSGSDSAADALFAGASVTAIGVASGSGVSMTVVHAWHYPHFYWYRDSDQGTDNGVRYANTYPAVASIPLATESQMITSHRLGVSKWCQHIEMCFLRAPSPEGAGCKTRLKSRIKKLNPHLIYDLFFRSSTSPQSQITWGRGSRSTAGCHRCCRTLPSTSSTTCGRGCGTKTAGTDSGSRWSSGTGPTPPTATQSHFITSLPFFKIAPKSGFGM